MNFSLIICTYKRSKPLLKLLQSVRKQRVYPLQIIVVDGSLNDKTEIQLQKHNFPNLEYFKVDEQHRGLTKQRNFGVSKVNGTSEIICFLDDDIVLMPTYFENLIATYAHFPDAIGVGGYIMDGTKWKKDPLAVAFTEFEFNNWKRPLGNRNVLRKKLGLLSDKPPGTMPECSHGFPISFLPPSGKTYPVEFFMGGVSSYKKELFQKIRFSTYFEGYGLYEDMDFCLRANLLGKLYVNTAAELFHHHEDDGRPNRFEYGKMILRNGWYVWRIKNPRPSLKARFKWHAISFLLTLVRLGNVFTTNQKKEVFSESVGRIAGWWGLWAKKPKISE